MMVMMMMMMVMVMVIDVEETGCELDLGAVKCEEFLTI
jgi:hypothetical protein